MNRVDFKKKLIIGTANFVNKYGVDSLKINENEIIKILEFSKKNKINKIDTAESYLNKKKIFKKNYKNFQFTTKIMPDHKWISFDYCQKKLDEHFKLFNENKIHTLLFHDFSILFQREGSTIFNNLEKLKKKKYFKKIGLSIYDVEDLDYLVSNYNLDIIQCPYNVLDKRIIKSGWFDKLKNKGIKIHARSIFLQGLLVNEFICQKIYFKRWKKNFIEWFEILKENDISPIDYCLNDLLDHNFDQIIIGVNSCENLKEILNFRKIKNRKNQMLKINKNDIKLIDPRNWK